MFSTFMYGLFSSYREVKILSLSWSGCCHNVQNAGWQRRSAEDAQIRQLSSKHAAIVQFKSKDTASLNTQQFGFTQLGPAPLQMSACARACVSEWSWSTELQRLGTSIYVCRLCT